MEAIIVVDNHRRQYHHDGNRKYGSPSSSGMNCRAFQYGAGLLPTPIVCVTPVMKRGLGFSLSLPFPNTPVSRFIDSPSMEKTNKNLKKAATLKKSSLVPIPVNYKVESDNGPSLFCDEFTYSELWAGPAYSNSPPPSSLPIPKFFVLPKRTVSLELPGSSVSGMNLHPIARSAPRSPKREHNLPARSLFHSADFATATKDLRRILNLDN